MKLPIEIQELLEAAKGVLFQVEQGKVLERDYCIYLLREAISKVERSEQG